MLLLLLQRLERSMRTRRTRWLSAAFRRCQCIQVATQEWIWGKLFGNRNINGTSDEFEMRTRRNKSIKSTGAQLCRVSGAFSRTIASGLMTFDLELSHQQNRRWWSSDREIAFGLDAWEGISLGLFGMLLDCEERERAIAKGFWEAAMSSSSSVQHLQCARFYSFLDHKSSSGGSTTTWRRGRSTKKSLLLRGVQPQFHFTQQQLLQNSALLLRVHRIQAVVGTQRSRKL